MTHTVPRLLAIAALGLAATAALAQEVSFGIIATDSASTQRERWEPFFRDMEKKTGLTVKSFYAPDYAGVIEAMRFNKVQVAWMGNKSAMEAVDRANGEIFAQIMYADGTYGYHGLLITHKDSPYKTLDDVFRNAKSIDFGIGDPNSTSGFLVPTFYLFAQRGVDHRTAFKTARNASHGANLQAVLARQVDVATNNTEDFGKLQATKPELASQIRVLWTSPLIPSDPFVWHKDLDPAIKAKLKSFVLGYAKTDAEEKAILGNIYSYGGFRESNNDQLIPIRQLELAKQRAKVETDNALDSAAKTRALAEIDAKLAALKS
ncbi:MAG: phosphonate ABC transporter substrate-binding protein [Rubrivivax sp.]|jgi:phosphonate transport system substrate-binding protein|nr:phosphonate ABC transporter substrate-binding protein [Betaproteobacteria bacterium]MBP6317006.1 phosphonate ABC transporter substrate-binding protein [Rubrivivax sp.]MBK7277523.1 phosphonate ABC transporter substrate-binding protein [Betaproteobacteria bacterium]MBK7460288.1 phosphonate ABC transporter substrate-binding protein [Betaproteobacteria bacterium]MBK7516205.1 phosphonate ABC transporter substrate-binding protein [Betaproteobacteria bacterium]